MGGDPNGYDRNTTLPKVNIEPENYVLEDDIFFEGCVLRFHLDLPGCINMVPKLVVFFQLPQLTDIQ